MTLDICVVKEDHSKYTSKKFSKFRADNLSKDQQLQDIYEILAKYRLYCPTIYKNKVNNNIVLQYETSIKPLYVIITDTNVKYKCDNLTYFSNKDTESITHHLDRLSLFIGDQFKK